MTRKMQLVPQVDGMEKRLLLNGSPVASPQSHVVSPGVHASSITAKSVTQAVVDFRNTSNLNVSFQFRWNSTAAYSATVVLKPGDTKYFWATNSSSLAPQVRFDQSVLPGWQEKSYTLSSFTYVNNGGDPPFRAGKLYEFQNVPGGVNLFSADTTAVTSFKNSSNLNVSFQFRWNSTSAYSATVVLKPGETHYWWASPPTASAPQVRFDQSVLPGWQEKSFTLDWNLYKGSSPPSSAGKLYTFKNVSGGVDLFT